MAIQIRETLLSPLAQKVMNNSKNKSQFVRDAIEFYVQTKHGGALSHQGILEISKEIQEIKMMLKLMMVNNLEAEERNIPKNLFKEERIFDPDQNVAVVEKVEQAEVVKQEEENISKSTVSQKTVEIEEKEIKVKPLSKVKEIPESENTNAQFSEQEKKEIEDLINNSINLF